jgi:hypothetical protein
MDPVRMYAVYGQAARTAVCPKWRTVHMLGMMCAAAIREGGIVAFVGQGHGGDWPNPQEKSLRNLVKARPGSAPRQKANE